MVRPLNQTLIDGWDRVLLGEKTMINKKIIIYPGVNLTVASQLLYKYEEDKKSSKTNLGHAKNVCWYDIGGDPDLTYTVSVYETKSAIIVRR